MKNAPPEATRSRTALLALAYLAFVSLGLPDTVLGVAWPSLRETFTLPQAMLGAPLATAATTYFLSGLLAVAFTVTRGRWGDGQPAPTKVDAPGELGTQALDEATRAGSGWTALRHPRVGLQVAVFFVYSGVEIAAGQWSYTVLTEARGVETTTAGVWVSLYWASLLAGRVVLGFVVERVGTVRLLRFGTGGAVVGTLLFAAPGLPPAVGAVGLALLGFALAPIYPGLMSETPRRVGAHVAPHAVGFQVSAATLGVAVIPNVAGLLGERFGLGAIAPLVAGCAVLLAVLHETLVATADRPTSP